MKIRAIVQRMLLMCPAAWYIFLRSLQLSCFLLFCAFLLLLGWEQAVYEQYHLYLTAMSLQESAQALLLVAVLLSALVEDASRGRS